MPLRIERHGPRMSACTRRDLGVIHWSAKTRRERGRHIALRRRTTPPMVMPRQNAGCVLNLQNFRCCLRLSSATCSRDDHDRMADQRHRSRRASNPPGRAARRGSSDCDATRTDWRDARAAEMPPKPSAPFGRARRSESGGQPLPPAQPHRPASRLRKGDAALISGAEDAPIFASCRASRTSFHPIRA
jgi:hypothetical protein